MRAAVFAAGSGIAGNLADRLERDGWEVDRFSGRETPKMTEKWDLAIFAHGRLSPVGKFFDTNEEDWIEAISVNALRPLWTLRHVWDWRNIFATVVFIGGPNMSKPSPTYTAYRASKAMLESLVGTLEAEYPDTQFRMLHPGVVSTKIHLQAVTTSAANYDRVLRIVGGTEATVSHDEVYERLKGLL